ncbi:MAG: phosphoribosylamine--glycine ligase [Candidatus Cloacimonetes bacterium]|nr:phosphoribosylamine--glycine ligase [Candidatus Cloacimonadota bacterium]MDD2506551.1 phosphoribosylamine--glycine ligase [Candidatus Cloacimonadota bacterium]MDD4147830.1 phosphoribosylamine--glycine ligase [Candidatus Cloacimonadota bacterium]MDD4559422.1 phosphoribosylamine--glycine ligase [Candidatus Cloacimonadota bacterium]
MKVLILGSGAREHAIADAFDRSPKTSKIYVSPGNDGIAESFECIKLEGFEEIRNFCENTGIDLVFIGPEQPIAEGLSDYLKQHSIMVFAPSKAAAAIEYSKEFAKRIMGKYHVPTARYRIIRDINEAESILKCFKMPVVLKADGLAAGKGVVISSDLSEAIKSCKVLLEQNCGANGVLAEEYLDGWEVSLFAICDGENFRTTLFAQDHKQLYDGDFGPNTGGMGAYCPVREAEEYRKYIENKILEPVLTALREEHCTYSGILYMGLMITTEGPKVIEFNCRLGDPETQVLLPLLKTDIMDICVAACDGKVDQLKLEWDSRCAVGVVLAAPGYPGTYRKDIPISIPQLESQLYFAGVKKTESGLRSSGGRVLTVLAIADSLVEARDKVYADINKISFPEMVYRKDIGLRANKLS